MAETLSPRLDAERQEQDPFERELNDFMSRQTFTDQLIAANKKKKAAHDPLSFANELREYWFLYAFLAVSALFTGMLGIFMGMSPKVLPDGSVYFHTDLPHLLMAALYGISFIAVTEFAFALAKRLFYQRESGNLWQALSMLAMMLIAGISVFGTGVAGGVIIASTIDFMTEFVSVPQWAQYWVVRIIPALIVLYAFLLVVYALSSTKAQTERIIRDRQRNHELDMEMRRKTLRQFAQEKIEREALRLYMKQINDGSISVAEALAAARAEDIFQAISQETRRQRRAQPLNASSTAHPLAQSTEQGHTPRDGVRFQQVPVGVESVPMSATYNGNGHHPQNPL